MMIGSLFSGIGGLELGLERAGLGHVVWQVESSHGKRAVLAEHWPEAKRYPDVVTFDRTDGDAVDVICGGFPCQDISSANVRGRAGLDGQHSGLWSHYRRIVAALGPRWVIVENSPRWTAWMPKVRADLAGLGYASVPVVVSAGFVGALHARPRGFVVAHANGDCQPLRAFDAEVARYAPPASSLWDRTCTPPGGFRLADGVPGEMGECAAYGDAVVPQVAEVIGRAIVAAMDACSARKSNLEDR